MYIQQDATLHSLFCLEIAVHVLGGTSNCSTRCCRYSCMRSWWWVEVPTKTCRAISRQNKLRNFASCLIYIRIFLQCMDPWTLNCDINPVALAISHYNLKLSSYSSNNLIKHIWYIILECFFFSNSVITVLLECLANLYSSCCKYISICSWWTYLILWSKQMVKLFEHIPWRHMEECRYSSTHSLTSLWHKRGVSYDAVGGK
jgi:hypothetical protein